jgi:hypothetical protein
MDNIGLASCSCSAYSMSGRYKGASHPAFTIAPKEHTLESVEPLHPSIVEMGCADWI